MWHLKGYYRGKILDAKILTLNLANTKTITSRLTCNKILAKSEHERKTLAKRKDNNFHI